MSQLRCDRCMTLHENLAKLLFRNTELRSLSGFSPTHSPTAQSAGGHLNVALYPHNVGTRAPLTTKLLKLGRIVLKIQTQTLKSTSHQSHPNAHYYQLKTVRQHNKSNGGRYILAVELMTARLSKN